MPQIIGLKDASGDVTRPLPDLKVDRIVHCAAITDFGKPGSYFTRQIHRWTQQYRASETERIEAMEELLIWLPEHIPAADDTPNNIPTSRAMRRAQVRIHPRRCPPGRTCRANW